MSIFGNVSHTHWMSNKIIMLRLFAKFLMLFIKSNQINA